ncbi:Imm21 family immunity protein [Streptomyces sp. NPDC046631]|uniref:Imm21 family immunity protein n=1 Tax=unclassified Streptomyces TaxID=2593676 RepID=UPI0033FC3925
MGISHDSNRCDRAGPVWVPSEDELFTAVEAVLLGPDTAWEDGGLWVTDGPAVLMDSAEAGADLGVEYPDGGRPGQAPAQLPAGRWRVRAVHRAEEFPWVGVVQLVPRGRPGRQRNGRLVWGIQLSGAGSTLHGRACSVAAKASLAVSSAGSAARTWHRAATPPHPGADRPGVVRLTLKSNIHSHGIPAGFSRARPWSYPQAGRTSRPIVSGRG